jgi:hypothetical protein
VPTKNIDPRLLELAEHKRQIKDLERELKQATLHIQNLSSLHNEKD